MQINVTKLRAALEIAPKNHKRSHLNSVHYHSKLNAFEATDTHCAIRIAKADTESEGIQRAQSIPDLRSPQWQRWSSLQIISNAANYARKLCRQAEW